MPKIQVTIGKRTFDGTPLDPTEADIFEAQLPLLYGGTDGSALRNIFEQHRDLIRDFVTVAKKKLNDAPFRGFHGEGTDLAWSHLRSRHLNQTDWTDTTGTADTWNTHWNTAASPGTLDEDICILILALCNKKGTIDRDGFVLYVNGKEQFMPVDLTPMILASNAEQVPVQAIPPTVIWAKETGYTETQDMAGGVDDELQMVGVVVGLANKVKTKTNIPPS